MSQFNRSTTFVDSTVIDPDIHNTEHDDISSAVNDNDSRLDDLETANIAYAGEKTWVDKGKFQSGLDTNDIFERTSGVGIRINNDLAIQADQMLFLGTLADQAAEDAITDAINGALVYRTDLNKFRGFEDGSWKNLVLGASENPIGQFVNPLIFPQWTSVTVVKFPKDLAAIDRLGNTVMTVAADINLSTATSGAGGIDTGAVANSTHYAPYLISNADATSVSVVLSTEFDQSVGPTLPTDFTLWRKLNVVYTTDSGGNLFHGQIIRGWPFMTEVLYNEEFTNVTTYPTIEAGVTVVLTGGTAAAFADVDASTFVPSTARVINFTASFPVSSTGQFQLRRKGDTTEGIFLQNAVGLEWIQSIQLACDTAQTIQYQKAAGFTGTTTLTLDVVGYILGDLA